MRGNAKLLMRFFDQLTNILEISAHVEECWMLKARCLDGLDVV